EEEVREVLREYGVPDESSEPVVQALRRQPVQWVNFMMRFELGLEEPDPRRARTSARNIALAYITGGAIPLAPYFFTPEPRLALQREFLGRRKNPPAFGQQRHAICPAIALVRLARDEPALLHAGERGGDRIRIARHEIRDLSLREADSVALRQPSEDRKLVR